MDPREIKQLLKEAKEALKKNDFMGAVKACKLVLKKEPENVQAYLLLGNSFRDQGKFQQSLEAYKKTITIDPKQVYGWQGVISVYERQNIREHTDLLDAYKRVATFFEKDDKQKYIENTLKLANILISQQDTRGALKVVSRLAKSCGLNVEVSQLVVLLLNSSTSETRTPEEDTLYTSALEVLITETPQPADETYRKFFSQLYRNKFYDKLAGHCLGMQEQWNSLYSPMDWICRLYLESKIDRSQLVNCGGIVRVTDRLFKLHPSSRFGYFARGKYLIEEDHKHVEGFTWIMNALESSFNIYAALVLIQGKLKFGDYEGAMEEAEKGIANCSSDKIPEKDEFQTMFKLLFIEGLIGSNDVDRAEQQKIDLEAVFKEQSDHPQIGAYYDCCARIALKKKQLPELTNLINSMESVASLNGLPVWRMDLYKAIVAAFKSDDTASTFIHSCILTNSKVPDLMLEGAIYLFDNGDFQEAAEILSDLASTPAGRNHPLTWKYLGQLANIEGDLQKAAKYLKKSFDLNVDSEVGALLSDIYHTLGEFKLKKELLTEATKKVLKTKSKWAWARLGIMYLEEGNLIEAVDSLQSAIRVDLEDAFLWETLADAYFYRGSLQAALRCYTKAIERGVDPVYPKMRISAIYQFLEEEDKSVSGLNELLEDNPDNGPINLELAKLYSWVAAEKIKENFDRGAISAVESGLLCVVNAILNSNEQMALPWMLIGDYSITIGELPERTEINVPVLLLQDSKKSMDSLEIGKTERINLTKFKEIGTKALLQCLDVMTNVEDIIIKSSLSLLSYLHHQISLSYYKRSCAVVQEDARQKMLLNALFYCKKAIANDTSNPLYWNTIGLISFHLADFSFAQHCFIRSLQLDTNNVTAWTNLGILYYKSEKFMLAHKAFGKGQSVAPIYAISWIGQALCAEVLDPSEAPDLFRHACLLRPHPFAISSYGNTVCDFLINPKGNTTEDFQYWSYHLLTRMDATTHLYDLISRIEHRSASPQLFNLKGLVAGWNGFYRTSLESFNKAVELASTEHGKNLSENDRVNMLSNKLSSLIALEMFSEAKNELMRCPTLDSVGLANAALILYKLNDISTAIDMYQRILELPSTSVKKPDVKILLAILVNQTMGIDAAKTILFGKDMMKHPRALLTLGAIAVAQSDLQLVRAVIHELKPSQWNPQLAHHIAFLKVCYEIIQKSNKAAAKEVFKFIHMYPTNAKLYALACQTIMEYNLETFPVSVPRHLALCTLKTVRIVGTSREESLFASKHSGVVSLTYLLEYNVKTAVMTTLKTIRCYPEQRDNWAVLACAYWMQYSKSRNPRVFLNIINILDREINLGLCSSRIREWMSSFRVEIAKYSLRSESK